MRSPDASSVPAPSPRARVRRHPERAAYDRAVIDAILAEGLLCHVAFDDDGGPVVVPMTYAPFEDGLVLHGAREGRVMRRLASGDPICVTVTLLDGLVLARSAMHHSMNYRSVMVFGRGEEFTDPGRKRAALDALVDHVVPGRRASIRGPSDGELDVTSVVWIALDEASAKVRRGPPIDAPADLSLPVWAGTIPLRMAAGAPEAHIAGAADRPVPPHVAGWPLRDPLPEGHGDAS